MKLDKHQNNSLGATELITMAIALPIIGLMVVGIVDVVRPMMVAQALKDSLKAGADEAERPVDLVAFAKASSRALAASQASGKVTSGNSATQNNGSWFGARSASGNCTQFAVLKVSAGVLDPSIKDTAAAGSCTGNEWREVYSLAVEPKVTANTTGYFLIGVGKVKIAGITSKFLSKNDELSDYVVKPLPNYNEASASIDTPGVLPGGGTGNGDGPPNPPSPGGGSGGPGVGNGNGAGGSGSGDLGYTPGGLLPHQPPNK